MGRVYPKQKAAIPPQPSPYLKRVTASARALSEAIIRGYEHPYEESAERRMDNMTSLEELRARRELRALLAEEEED